MTSLIAYLFGPPEASAFDVALNKYLHGLRAQEDRKRRDDDDVFIALEEWLGSLPMEIEDSENESLPFIAQCERPTSDIRAEEKQIRGTVTSITDEGGLIDDHIYFNVNEVTCFESDEVVKVGDQVEVRATLPATEYSAWKAVSVMKVCASRESEWNETQATALESVKHVAEQDTLISCVCSKTEDRYAVDTPAEFSLKDVKGDYVPQIGDWVKGKISESGRLCDIEPLRVKEVTGKVTRLPRQDKNGTETHKGAINDSIQFSRSTGDDGYSPRMGDEVKVAAVESKQNLYSWRAVSVVLLAREKGESRQKMTSGEWVLKGVRPPDALKRASVPSFLPNYPIPKSVRQCVEDGMDVLRLLPALKQDLNMGNYAARFHALLYLEEVSSEIEIRKYYLYGVKLERRGQFLCLYVAGISDGRPSLSVGDCVVLHEVEESFARSPEHHGFIHHILLEKEKLLIKFHATLHDNFEDSDVFNVEFKYSRTPIRRCHLAVELASQGPLLSMIFPEGRIKAAQECQSNIRFTDGGDWQNGDPSKVCSYFNHSLNKRQRQAVERVVRGEVKAYPYILFGPPGTGKTVVLVEIILQIYHLFPWSRILVCAPSNSAVDLLCERLSLIGHLSSGDMCRFNAFRRLQGTIPETVSGFCHDQESVQRVSRYRVILTTCVNAGIFYSLQLPRDHFTHICVDEAGQATEPEILIPTGLMHGGQMVMAGDPQQLGAVVMSPLAKLNGLDISLLSRLMNFPMYERDDNAHEDGYNPLLITKFTNNYRSHHKLLDLPSRMFYDGELQARAARSEVGQLLDWRHLPSRGFPMLFHGILGEQLRESDSPSLMNPAEIVQTMRYVKLLHSEENVDASHIGIVSPYRKQVEKIRIMLKTIGIFGVKVGSVEEFQGQERPVILISTVRSLPVNRDAYSEDSMSVRTALGFVSNPKRFNVAITRAKSLLVITGNPFYLALDFHWKCLLQYCVENGGYTGCDISSLDLNSGDELEDTDDTSHNVTAVKR